MTYIFAIFILLGLWHLYYEQVISASIKQGLKYEFYKLRDELRMANIKGIENKNDKLLFEILDGSICGLIYTIEDITLSNYFLFKKEYKKDKAYRKASDYVSKLSQQSDNETLIRIEKDMMELGVKALLMNHGGLLPYVIAPLVVWWVISLISSQVDKFKTEIENISSRMVFNSQRRVRYTPSGKAKVVTVRI